MIIILNRGFGSGNSLEDHSLTEELTRLLDNTRQHFYDKPNRLFAYDDYSRSTLFHDYRSLTRALTACEPSLIENDNERKTFWLNLYNGLAINAVISHRLKQELKAHKLFYSQTCYQVGRYPWSLDKIEHGVLRANRTKFRSFTKPFGSSHKVLPLLLAECDPRIHAALYTPCQSSPVFSAYSSEYLDQQLDTACREMVANDVVITGNCLKLPMIFKWYQKDFGTPIDVVSFITHHMEDKQAAAELQEKMKNKQLKLDYIPYSWVINAR